MATPEAKIKAAVKKLLKERECWYYMPVPAGYGVPTLDFICATPDGVIFCIETKAPGRKPTPRQRATIREYESKNIKCFVIDGDMSELTSWLGHKVSRIDIIGLNGNEGDHYESE